MIKNNVMGKKITRNYETRIKRDDDGLLTAKPKLDSKDSVEWVNLLAFDGTNIRANNEKRYSINLNNDEVVSVIKEAFVATKNEMILYTTKEVEIVEPNKDESNRNLEKLIQEYNKQEIEKDQKLLSYCKLHNLIPEHTDVDELKKVVYEGNIATLHCGGFINTNDICWHGNTFTIQDNSQTIL